MNETHLLLKHMMNNGAPPDKYGVLYCLLPIEFHGFKGRTILYEGGLGFFLTTSFLLPFLHNKLHFSKVNKNTFFTENNTLKSEKK